MSEFMQNLPPTFTHLPENANIWRNFTTQKNARDLLGEASNNLIMVASSDSIDRALHILANKKISSIPVVSQDGILGIVHILDIVTFAISLIGDTRKPITNFEQKFRKEFERPVSDIINLSRRDIWHVISEEQPLHNVIKTLSNPNVHRVLVHRKGNPRDFIGVITQSQMVDYLLKSRDSMDNRLKARVREMWPESRPVFTVSQKELMIDAFQKICQSRASGVAVVDDQGALVGNVSASDIKHAGLEKYTSEIHTLVYDLSQEIGPFLRISGGRDDPVCPSIGKEFGRSKTAPAFTPIAVTMDDTLDRILQLLGSTFNSSSLGKIHIHRVYVVDDKQKPLRALSLSDVIAQFSM